LSPEAQQAQEDANQASTDNFKKGIPEGVLEGYLTGKHTDVSAMGMKYLPVMIPFVAVLVITLISIFFNLCCVCCPFCPIFCKKRKDLKLGKKRYVLFGMLVILSLAIMICTILGFSSARIFSIGLNKTTCALGSLWDTTIFG